MDIEALIREDIWDAIQLHYVRKDYSEAIRDATLFICELIRDKSGYTNLDGTKLMEAAFLGANPAIHINKSETQTEKDIQQGIGYALKGIMMSIRNPLSHKIVAYTQDEANSIILYINYLLNKVDEAKSRNKIEDWMELLTDQDFTSSSEYAQELLKEIPNNKKYDILIELFNKRNLLKQNRLNCFIHYAITNFTKIQREDFVNILNRELLLCHDDTNLRMYLHYFLNDTYADLNNLVRLRIEDLILNAVRLGKYNTATNKCDSGSLGSWISRKVDMLSNKDEVINALFNNLDSQDEKSENYVFEYFTNVIFDSTLTLNPWQIELINKKLQSGDKRYYDSLYAAMNFEEKNVWQDYFKEAYDAFKEYEPENELPW